MPPAEPNVETLPVLPLRNAVIFPAQVVPINVGRPRSVRLIEELFGRERPLVAVVAQRSPDVDEPSFEDLYGIGIAGRIVKVIRIGPGNYSVLVQGISRIRLTEMITQEPFITAKISRIPENLDRDVDVDRLGAQLRELFSRVLEVLPTFPKEAKNIVDNVREPGALADLVTSALPIDIVTIAERQEVLETTSVRDRLASVVAMARRCLELAKVKKEVTTMVTEEMNKPQRESLLRQQMRAIREELGEGGLEDEIDELREQIANANLPPDVLKVAKKQLARLAAIPPQSAEYGVAKTYLEWIAELPWAILTGERLEVDEVRRCLDEDHHGLEKIKRRIVEHIAVAKLRKDRKAPILCLVGPPGVGKTSVCISISRATGRRLHRISLGGVRDEAEIRGHRRTYVGSLPGRILQGLRKIKTRNPILQLDEIDKMGVDQRGDPASALLELLDPSQNDTFTDHYLELPFDMSRVMFLATGNQLEEIPEALRDRMDIIEIPGYTRTEKMHIATDFVIPKCLASHGLTIERLEFLPEGVATIIEGYTREAGVRELERQVSSICRHVAMRLAEGKHDRVLVDADVVRQVLGPEKHYPDLAERLPQIGIATGLAWTPTGGDVLFIECSSMPGKGNYTVTGNLRNVMQESAHAALSYVRSHYAAFNIDEKVASELDLHVHVPQGAIPKDGPSAGITLFTAIVSRLSKVPVRGDIAMTGEITLRGQVLPIGGLKEKVLAAHRAGVKKVLYPAKNKHNLEDIPQEIRDEIELVSIRNVREVAEHALVKE